MSQDREDEIASLTARLAALEESKPQAPKRKSGNLASIIFLLVVILVLGFVAVAWNAGRESSLHDDAVGSACRAASSTGAETDACLTDMATTYHGSIEPEPLANAAAQYVADFRSDHS